MKIILDENDWKLISSLFFTKDSLLDGMWVSWMKVGEIQLDFTKPDVFTLCLSIINDGKIIPKEVQNANDLDGI